MKNLTLILTFLGLTLVAQSQEMNPIHVFHGQAETDSLYGYPLKHTVYLDINLELYSDSSYRITWQHNIPDYPYFDTLSYNTGQYFIWNNYFFYTVNEQYNGAYGDEEAIKDWDPNAARLINSLWQRDYAQEIKRKEAKLLEEMMDKYPDYWHLKMDSKDKISFSLKFDLWEELWGYHFIERQGGSDKP